MTTEIKLRDRKKGILRLQILQTFQDLLKERRFDDIKVKDICRIVNTSEVTFFKYFQKKEEILSYYMQVWNYKRESRITGTGRSQGIEGIYRILNDISETEQAQEIMLSFITYVSRLREHPESVVLEDYEKKLLFEDENMIVPVSLKHKRAG